VKTSVRDPLTLQDRAFSGNSMFFYTGELRQDLGKFAWSVSMSGNTGSTFFRLGETDTNQNPSPNVSAFVEYRPNARTTVTLGADNLLDSPAKRWRYFYAPNRSTSAPFQEEYRERNGHRSIYVTVKRSFG
jgi:outer membrane receptor protein involved in Fe transport